MHFEIQRVAFVASSLYNSLFYRKIDSKDKNNIELKVNDQTIEVKIQQELARILELTKYDSCKQQTNTQKVARISYAKTTATYR